MTYKSAWQIRQLQDVLIRRTGENQASGACDVANHVEACRFATAERVKQSKSGANP